jgi:hypothetical protein
MTLEQTLTIAVEQAVRRAVEPLRQELEKLRAEQHAEAIPVAEADRRFNPRFFASDKESSVNLAGVPASDQEDDRTLRTPRQGVAHRHRA